MPLFLFQFL